MFKLVILSTILLYSVAEAQLQKWEHYPTFKNDGKNKDAFEYKTKSIESFWDNRVSFIKAIKGDYVLYKEPNFQGDSIVQMTRA